MLGDQKRAKSPKVPSQMKPAIFRLGWALGLLGPSTVDLVAIDRTDTIFPIFQFPADQIPRVDGDASDWAMVPESYVIGTDELVDDSGKYPTPSPETLQVRVRVGWVRGLNRLYFLYDATDEYWDFAGAGLRNDTFEVVVDGDLSGGPLIARWHPAKEFISEAEAYESFQSVHAQNYHIFTPALEKSWCMFWGPAQWVKELPYANAATRYDFKPGEGGRLVLEFWITPFDYAGADGPGRAVESILREDKLIGLSWAVIDYDAAGGERRSNGFWNLSRKHTMFGQADELCMFRLMPLEPEHRSQLKASWSHQVLDYSARRVAFRDESEGVVTSWAWDFGDGSTSTEQNPIHTYAEPGRFVVVLQTEGPAGKSRLAKVWDVSLWSDLPPAGVPSSPKSDDE